MPAIRVMDEAWVQPDSFVIQAYQKVLYSEQLAGQKDVASYIGKRIEETVGDLHNYHISLTGSWSSLLWNVPDNTIQYCWSLCQSAFLTGICSGYLRGC